MSQNLRPNSTISTGPGGGSQWDPQGGAGSCHEALSDQSDVTWVMGADHGNLLKLGLSAGSIPAIGPRTLTLRAAADMTSLGFTVPGKINVDIRDGSGVLIEALQTPTIADNQTPQNYPLVVTGEITDYSGLQLWITVDNGWDIGLDAGLFEVDLVIPSPPPYTMVTTGWTELPAPPVGARTVHVSSSDGDDGNDGLTPETPVQSLATGLALLRSGFGDRMLLKRGDTWSNVGIPLGNDFLGASADAPTIIAAYGEGNRPVIDIGEDEAAVAATRPVHLWIMDLEVHSTTWDGTGNGPVGIRLLDAMSDILIENCKLYRLAGGIVADDQSVSSSNVRILRNVVYECWTDISESGCLGIYCAGIDGLKINQNVLDHNGWLTAEQSTQFRRNLYVQGTESGGDPSFPCSNVVYRRNINARSASEGAQLRTGGDATANLHLLNSGFYHGVELGSGVTHRIAHNCTLDSRDIDSSNSEWHRGGGVEIGGGSPCFGNLFAYRSTPAGFNLIAIGVKAGGNPVIQKNVIYDWSAAGAEDPIGVADVEAAVTFNFHDNDVQFPTACGSGVQLCLRVGNPGPISLNNNRYLSQEDDKFSNFFSNYGSLAEWQTESGGQDAASTYGAVTYTDPDRRISDYMTSINSGTASLGGFLHEARLQERGNWRHEFTAGAVANYAFAGFQTDLDRLSLVVAEAPTGLAADPGSTTIDLSWDSLNTRALFDHYNVYRDGLLIDTADDPEFTDTPGDTDEHDYVVTAVDDDGFETPFSAPVTSATAPGGGVVIGPYAGKANVQYMSGDLRSADRWHTLSPGARCDRVESL